MNPDPSLRASEASAAIQTGSPRRCAPRDDGQVNVADAVCDATKRLRAAGVESPRRDARLLLSLAVSAAHPLLLDPDHIVDPSAWARFNATVDRRAAREPIARIRGVREFWGLEFLLSAATLDPRPDTETLIEGVLDAFHGHPAPSRILDLGAGSGCILAALLGEFPEAVGVGVDIAPEAIATASANAERLALAPRTTFLVGDWTAAGAGLFDLVVSNPPYIPSDDIDGLAPEVAQFDPRRALDGGADGLDAYRALVPLLPDLLVPNGVAAVEIGDGQADEVMRLFRAHGLDPEPPRADLGGVSRVVIGRANPARRRA